jgi:2-amino-4-hydroxy-6-hydroxymethyldihydropteridine diphosphokinase
MMRRVYIGIGSNLGDRDFLVRKAVEALRQLPQTNVSGVSSLYDTEPVGETEQPPFLNAVAWIETELPARDLLWQMLLIERRMGRVRAKRWGPRPIDLDLLFYDTELIDEPDLQVPHPEANRRAFVLLPLLELDPHFRHPVTGETVRRMIQKLPPNPPVRKLGRFWY